MTKWVVEEYKRVYLSGNTGWVSRSHRSGWRYAHLNAAALVDDMVDGPAPTARDAMRICDRCESDLEVPS